MKSASTIGIRTFRHYKIAGYPSDVAHIVSDEGYGRNDYVETEAPAGGHHGPSLAAVEWPPACIPSCTTRGTSGA